MRKTRVFIVHEYDIVFQPHGSAFIRMIRPLTHPTLADQLQIQQGWDYAGEEADIVLVDRLWRPDVTIELIDALVARIRSAGAKFGYMLDDDLLALPVEKHGENAAYYRQIVTHFLREADGVFVTTPTLKSRLSAHTDRCILLPNALDERLLAGGRDRPVQTPFGQRRKIIGYMGTFTHEADLAMILPAWQKLYTHYPNDVEFQIVGVTEHMAPLESCDIPLRVISPKQGETDYPLFMLWFTSKIFWDIAIAPLQDTPFNASKSDIKFLDYGAMGAAGIFSRVPAYQESIDHLQTGWLTDNRVDGWYEALKRLLEDDRLRISMAKRATQYLYQERTLAHTAQHWLQALDAL